MAAVIWIIIMYLNNRAIEWLVKKRRLMGIKSNCNDDEQTPYNIEDLWLINGN